MLLLFLLLVPLLRLLDWLLLVELLFVPRATFGVTRLGFGADYRQRCGSKLRSASTVLDTGHPATSGGFRFLATASLRGGRM